MHNVNNNTNLWITLAHETTFNRIENEVSYDFCAVHENAANKYFNNSFEDGDVIPCKSFEYRPIYYSLILQYELFCSREALVALTQSFHLLGVLLGGLIATEMLKRISPRRIMLIGMILQIVLGILTGYAPTYELHLLFRCSVAGTCSMMCIGLMTIADITLGKYRAGAVCMFEQFWSIGVILLPLVGSWWNSWSTVYVAITLPTVLIMLLYPWIPDSPRWLIKHGYLHEAKNILVEAAEMNGKIFDPMELEYKLKSLIEIAKKDPPEPKWTSIWKGPKGTKRKVFAAHIGWSIYLSLHFSLLLNVRVMGRNYLEVNTALMGLSELIGAFIGLYLILNTTRKWLWMSLMNIATSSLAVLVFVVPDSIPSFNRMEIYMLAAFVNKVTSTTSLSIFITSMPEIVTKDKKKICQYSGSVCSRTVVMAAPFIGFCAVYGQLSKFVIPKLSLQLISFFFIALQFHK